VDGAGSRWCPLTSPGIVVVELLCSIARERWFLEDLLLSGMWRRVIWFIFTNICPEEEGSRFIRNVGKQSNRLHSTTSNLRSSRRENFKCHIVMFFYDCDFG
jgi:hypothetical protein